VEDCGQYRQAAGAFGEAVVRFSVLGVYSVSRMGMDWVNSSHQPRAR